MTPPGDLEHFSDSVDDMFRRLGLPDPELMSGLTAEWEELAGAPWAGRSKPLYIKGSSLVVEASSRSMIAFLRYGESSLIEALEKRFGQGVITTIEIRSPGQS